MEYAYVQLGWLVSKMCTKIQNVALCVYVEVANCILYLILNCVASKCRWYESSEVMDRIWVAL